MANTPLKPPSNPGASATAVIYDNANIPGNAVVKQNRAAQRVCAGVYTNVADAVFKVEWAAPGSTTLRTAASWTIPASTYFQRDVLIQPGRMKISIVTITAPGTWEVGAELNDDRALGQ